MFDFLDGALFESANFGENMNLSTEDDAYMESIESIIPEEDDLDDAFARVAMESVENFYAIANAITVDEFVHYVQTNEAVIYEEGRISGVMEKIKEWIKKAWAKIKGIFEKAINWIESQVRNDKNFVEKYRDKIKNSKPVKMQAYANVKGIRNTGGYLDDIIDAFDKETKAMGKDIDTFDATNSDYGKSKSDNSYDASKILTSIRSKVMKGKDVSAESFNKQLRDLIIGEKSEVTFTPSEVLDEVAAAKESRATIKLEYNRTKKYFNTMLKLADNVKKFAVSATSRKDAKESGVMKIVGTWNSVCKGCISMAHTVERVFLKGVNISRSQSKAAARKMATGEKEEVKESAGFLGSLELI